MPIVLAPMAAVFAGLMALAVLMGVIVLADIFSRAASAAGLPALIRNGLIAFAVAVRLIVTAIAEFLAWIARPVLSMLLAPARTFIGFVNGVLATLWTLRDRVYWVIYTLIPSINRVLWEVITNTVNSVRTLAIALHNSALSTINSIRVTLAAAITTGLAVLRTQLVTLIQSVSTALAKAVLQLTGLLANLERTLLARITQMAQWAVATAVGVAVDQARRYSDAIIGAYRDAVNALAGTAIAAAWPHVLDAIDALVRATPGSLADVLARTGVFPRAVPRTLAGALTAVAAVGVIGLDWVSRCGTSLCRNVLGFGDELAALDEELTIVDILSLVVGAITDPHDTADDVNNIMRGEISGLTDDFAGILATVE